MRLFRRRQAPPVVPVARRVRELEITTARLVRQGFAGQYHAAFHGRGLEFSQVRDYIPGDDVRSIDWNVTARTGKPHVKEFVEERDLTMLIVLDVSGSMRFGSLDRRKSTVAAEVVAALSYAALYNGDRVGLLLYGAERKFITPRRGRSHVQAVVREAILSDQTRAPANQTAFIETERFVTNVMKRRAVLIVISDFIGGDAFRSLRRLAARHDVVAIHVHDPREALFPSRGIVQLVDAESGARSTVDLASRGVIDRGRATLQRVPLELSRAAVDSVSISTAAPYDRELVRFFERRVTRAR